MYKCFFIRQHFYNKNRPLALIIDEGDDDLLFSAENTSEENRTYVGEFCSPAFRMSYLRSLS